MITSTTGRYTIEVGQAGRLFDVWGYVWPKIWTAVVYGRHVQSFPAPFPGAAGTLAVFGGPSKSGRYVYGFWRPKKERPVRLRFSAAQKKTVNTFTVFKTMPTSKHSKGGCGW